MTKKRLVKVLVGAGIVLALGFVYLCIVRYFDIAIPCLFNLITHLKCPGCGITTLFVCLSKGDVLGAFEANQLTFVLLPFYLFLISYLLYKYIKTGSCQTGRFLNVIIIIIICLYVAFGVLRNIL